MMTTNLFGIANVKQLRFWVVLEFYYRFSRTCWGVGALNSAVPQITANFAPTQQKTQ